ncbi:MAG TPA: hypothetical protein VMT20_07085 [Terriglobia bacterium]|nr:hypothetical protein [Terriglobia bacterium]
MEGWTAGLNTISAPYQVEQAESRDCLNVVSTERGAIRKRYGSTQFMKSAEIPNVELTSMFACQIGSEQYVLVSNGAKIWSVTSAGAVAEIGSGFTEGTRWSMVQAPKSTAVSSQGPIYMVNGVDKPQFWTGATASTSVAVWKGISAAPKPKDGAIVQGTNRIKSTEAGFFPGDVGIVLKFGALKVKAEEGEVEITQAVISGVTQTNEAELELPGEYGWAESKTGIEFTIERAYYEKEEHVPNGQYMVFFGNRIWMTGIKADPSAVWFSELVSIGEGGSQADPAQWPTFNVVRFDSSDGKEITGIGTVGPYVLLFKEFKTWVIHDVNTGANRRIAQNVGCVAHRSIVESGEGTFFLTADQGVYLTNGSTVKEMSYNIRPTILSINGAQRANAAGAYYNNHYYLSFATGAETKPNRTIDYDLVLKSWWLHDLTGNAWTRAEPETGKVVLLSLRPETKAGIAKSFVEGIYTDLGAVYTGKEGLCAYFLTNWEPFAYYIFRHRVKAPFLKKRIRQIFFNGEGSITPIVYKDFGQGGRQEAGVSGSNEQWTKEFPINFAASEEKWGEGSGSWATEGGEVLWGGEMAVGQARIYSPGVAFTWSVGWGNNSAEPFVVDAFTYMAQFRKS